MKILIVGGNATGMSAASKLRRLDKKAEIIVLERGGDVSYGSCGLPYFIGGINNDENMLRIRSAEEFRDKANIQIKIGHEAIGLDAPNKSVTVRVKDGREYVEGYDKLVISTGAAPVFPSFPGRDLNNIFVLKSIEDGQRIKAAAQSKNIKTVTIVGSGFIGIELAEAFITLKKNVRIIEMMPRVMNNYESEITEILEHKLRDHGVELQLGEAVQSFEGNETVTSVTTDKGSYPTDMVIVSIGVSPNTNFMRDTKGLEFLKNGAVVVNSKMETGVQDIYAGGDCATVYNKITKKNTYIALATNANKQGRIIGENLAGARRELPGRLGTSALKFMDLETAKTGVGFEEAQAAGYDADFTFIETSLLPQYYTNNSSTYIKLVYDKNSKKILGACMAGSRGTALRIDIFATAITAGMTTNDISDLDLVYAPPFALAWDAVQVAAKTAK